MNKLFAICALISIFHQSIAQDRLYTKNQGGIRGNLVFIGNDSVKIQLVNSKETKVILKSDIRSVYSPNKYKQFIINQNTSNKINLSQDLMRFHDIKTNHFREAQLKSKWLSFAGAALYVLGTIPQNSPNNRLANIMGGPKIREFRIYLIVGPTLSFIGFIQSFTSYKYLKNKKYYSSYEEKKGYYFSPIPMSVSVNTNKNKIAKVPVINKDTSLVKKEVILNEEKVIKLPTIPKIDTNINPIKEVINPDEIQKIVSTYKPYNSDVLIQKNNKVIFISRNKYYWANIIEYNSSSLIKINNLHRLIGTNDLDSFPLNAVFKKISATTVQTIPITNIKFIY